MRNCCEMPGGAIPGLTRSSRTSYLYSEVKFQRRLNISLSLRCENLAERQTGHRVIRGIEMRRVRQVEELGAKLQPFRFYGYGLLQRQIEISQPGPANHADSGIAQCFGDRLLKIGGVNPSAIRTGLMRLRGTADHIRARTLAGGAGYVSAFDG